MSGLGSNYSVASPMSRIQSQLECPVCFIIPRELPVPCCPSGHIVCRPCKERVRDCPTCRQPMPANMTNSVVGALIDEVQHKCKYSDQGCEVKLMLKDLVTHEEQCPEGTFICPYSGCAKLVKLKDFDKHLEDQPARVHYISHGVSKLFYTITNNEVINDAKWSMGMVCTKALDQFFHVNIGYHNPSKCFVVRICLAKSQDVASKYRVNILIKGDHRSVCFDGIKVCSTEHIPSIDECMEENGNLFMCIPIGLAKNFSIEKEDGLVDRKEDLCVEFEFKEI